MRMIPYEELRRLSEVEPGFHWDRKVWQALFWVHIGTAPL